MRHNKIVASALFLIIFLVGLTMMLGSTSQVAEANSNSELLLKKDYLKEIAPLKKTYRVGDHGPEVKRIEEWLMLWQLNENYVSDVIFLNPDAHFDETTEKVLKQVQLFLNLPASGIVDNRTWEALISPMKEAFSLKSFENKTLRQKMKYFATKHLQYRASELLEKNEGPWVRAYMDDRDGKLAYWCQGFVCTVLDQVFSTIGEYFSEYYANTPVCEIMREKARSKGLLFDNADLKRKNYVPDEGDLVLYISNRDGYAHHTEIIYEILDHETGEMLTIGGNTNFSGSHDGVGTFLVNRNFLHESVEIVQLVDEAVFQVHQSIPLHVRQLLRAYSSEITHFQDGHIVFRNGTKLLYDDGKKKTTDELLTEPDIKDQFFYVYPKGKMTHPQAFRNDPGRVTNQDFFKALYGATPEEVEKNLVEIVWAPKLDGRKITVTAVNGMAYKLEAIGKELDHYPELKPFVSDIGGTYEWRVVSGTDRLSLHSFGIAIDINDSKSSYWQWDCGCKDEKQHLSSRKSQIPQIIIDTFEKYGFIWGGKWYHYDTMHFEYRPELLLD